jgi:hypothetical protein
VVQGIKVGMRQPPFHSGRLVVELNNRIIGRKSAFIDLGQCPAASEVESLKKAANYWRSKQVLNPEVSKGHAGPASRNLCSRDTCGLRQSSRIRDLSADVILPKVGLGLRRDVEFNQKDQAHDLIQSHRRAIVRLRHNLAKIERLIGGWRRSGAKSGRYDTELGRDDSGYRVIEAENGMFAVELWQSGNCLYEADGFQTREQAEAWIIPV